MIAAWIICLFMVSIDLLNRSGHLQGTPGVHGSNVLYHKKNGNVVIGATFPIHRGHSHLRSRCQSYDIFSYQMALTVVFVTEKVNKALHLLPNITLGFEIYDSCNYLYRVVRSMFTFVTASKNLSYIPNFDCHSDSSIAAAFIADSDSRNSITIARVLGLYRFPQISYAQEISFLSNVYEFPSFLRTSPNTLDVHEPLIQLLLYYQWTWVGILSSSDDDSILILKEKLIDNGICIDFFKPIISTESHIATIIKLIKTSTAKVILASNSEGLDTLITEVTNQNITGRIWIGLGGWTTAVTLMTTQYFNLLCGSLTVLKERAIVPGFREFIYKYLPQNQPNDALSRPFWAGELGYKWPKVNGSNVTKNKESTFCTGSENLHEFSNTDDLVEISEPDNYATYNAIWSVVHALHKMASCAPGDGPFTNGSCAEMNNFHPWQLFHYLRNIHFTNEVNKEIFFNNDGFVPVTYEVIANYIVDEFYYITPVGQYDAERKTLDIFNNNFMKECNKQYTSVCSASCLAGFRKALQTSRPACCYDCIPCADGQIANQTDSEKCLICPFEEWSNGRRDKCLPRHVQYLSYSDPLGTALTSISISGDLLLATILIVFIKFAETPIVKANNRNISYLLLVALQLCFLCSLIFIGQPSMITCTLRQAIFGISFVLCLSCVLAKTMMVVIAFNATKPDSNLKRYVGPYQSYAIVSACTLTQALICVIWLVSSPPFLEQNVTSYSGLIILECNEGSGIAFWCMLGYMGLLAAICFFVAFLSRHLPDSFNEAKFITFSMVVFVCVWLTFIPAYLSTKGKYTVAVEVFAILSSSSGLIVCIIFPKCYIILLRPDMNTKEYLMRKGAYRDKTCNSC